ncbi:hypothetical protein SAMN02799620_00266 [Mycolicibacterium fluoranthenivorans]|jgi:hypothetical protein|uniref:Uncharacterized protein n=1 Tax=Mycolicibacterium fluoranthenivorans TaxID=258505 RepID=A0A1G4V7D8_9MYCO|nr:hypothetical protein [Mycolicibacterium fluoranthenivorans]SCX01441.1 hypothetical protein SAMN02799620_00266 [Mycolicibacterium fluoranthenivorans]
MPTHGTPGLVFTIGCASAVALSASEGEHNATVATMLTVNRFDLLRMFSPSPYLTPESRLKVSPTCVISMFDRFDGYRSDTKAS